MITRTHFPQGDLNITVEFYNARKMCRITVITMQGRVPDQFWLAPHRSQELLQLIALARVEQST